MKTITYCYTNKGKLSELSVSPSSRQCVSLVVEGVEERIDGLISESPGDKDS